MKRIKCLFIMIMFFTMSLPVFASGSSTPMSVKEADPKQTVFKAYQELLNLKNYHMTINSATTLSIRGKNVNTVMVSEVDAEVKPFLCKNTMNITTDTDSKRVEKKVVQYMEESGEQIIVYSNINNQWVKNSIPKGNYNPLNEYDNYIKAIKSVTLKSEDADVAVFNVIANGNYLKENMKRKIPVTAMQKIQLTDDLLKDVGDLEYTITIDKKTLAVSRIDMDLSDFMSKFGKNLAETMKISDDKKENLKEMFSNMKIMIEINFSQFDTVEKIIIPQEAKKDTNL